MSTSLNISIAGFVGGDVTVREVGEQRVASFSVAVNRKNSNGEQKTLWVRINCWNKLADVATEYLHSGSHVLVLSSWMRSGAWIDQSGNAQANIDITADRLILLDRPMQQPADNIIEDIAF